MVYIHEAEMDTWIVHMTDGVPVVFTSRAICDSISELFRALRDGSPAHCYVLCSDRLTLDYVRESSKSDLYHATEFHFILGDKFT